MPNRKATLLCLLLIAITIGVYWKATSFDFIALDDGEYVSKNPQVESGLSWAGVKWAFQTDCASNWHPLTWISHMADCQLFGLKPSRHHLENILFHALNAMLLFLVLQIMTGAMWRSCVVALLFALHPAHVESVAWIAERKDVLSTFFGLLAMLAYAFYVRVPRTKNASIIYYLMVLLFFALSLLSKGMLVTLPCLLLLLDFWPLRRMRLSSAGSEKSGTSNIPQRGLKALVLEKVPMLVMVVLVSFLTMRAQKTAGSVMKLEKFSVLGRVEHALVSYVKYIEMMVWPSKLAIFYPFPGSPGLLHALVALFVVCAVTFFVAQRLREMPFLAVGWLWFLGTLVPVIGLVQVGSQTMADRYTYFPFIGLFIALVWFASETFGQSRYGRVALAGASAIALGACGVVTSLQLNYWRDSRTLFAHALEVTQGNFIAYTILGEELEEAGKSDEAFEYFNSALKYMPDYPPTLYCIGKIYRVRGEHDKAIESFRRAEKYRPNAPENHAELGQELLLENRVDEASDEFSMALTLNPRDAVSNSRLAEICMVKNDSEDAISYNQAALAIDPNNIEALNNLAWIRAASRNPEFRNGQEAVQLAQRACASSKDIKPVVLGTLAAAYAEAGQFSNAVATATKARDLARANKEPEIAERNTELLKLYQAGKAYHEGEQAP